MALLIETISERITEDKQQQQRIVSLFPIADETCQTTLTICDC
jgi:hypothetical protein